MIGKWLIALRWGLQVLLAAFFGFVGYMKAFAPMADLATHRAWVAEMHPAIARSVGWSEILCAFVLLLAGLSPRHRHWVSIAALVLIANQIIALAVHAAAGDPFPTLVQNIILILLLAMVALGYRKSQLKQKF